MSKTTLLEASSGVFLDIASCGSSIRWGVEVHESVSKKGERSLSAETQVNLTDCSRAITWSDSIYCHSDEGFNTQLKKVDAAIMALREYRIQLRTASKMIELHHKKHPQNDN